MVNLLLSCAKQCLMVAFFRIHLPPSSLRSAILFNLPEFPPMMNRPVTKWLASSTATARSSMLLLVLLSLLVTGCARSENTATLEADQTSLEERPGADTEDHATGVSGTGDAAGEVADESVPATVVAIPSIEGGTIPPVRATLAPLEETIARLFLDSLGGGFVANGTTPPFAILRAQTPDAVPATWLVHTTGLRDFETNSPHRVNIYQQLSEHVVSEVARLNLNHEAFGVDAVGEPDYLGEGSAHQVMLDPALIFFALEGGVGAHGGVYDLLKFDPADTSLKVAFVAHNDSPGVASEVDLNGDGSVDIIVNATDPYVFCYACGVRFPQATLWRWDGNEIVEVHLTTLDVDASAEAIQTNDTLLALTAAGLWNDVYEMLPSAEALLRDNPAADPNQIMAWNLRLLRLNAEAKRGAALDEDSPFPLLSLLFYGDFDGALAVVKRVTPQELLASPSALVADTVAQGWEETLANWIERATAPAVLYAPDLAGAWFVRGWGDWLVGDLVDARANFRQAATLLPDDAYIGEVVALLEESSTEGGAHIVALTPIEVRSGPGNSFSIVATLQPGQMRSLSGRFGVPPDLWWQLANETGEAEWIFADDARVQANAVNQLPAVVAPAQMAPVALQGRLFYSLEADGLSSIFEIGVSASSPVALIIEQARQPALFAQSDMLAFSSQRPDMLGLGGISLATGERYRYTYNLEDSLPRWNAAGDRLLFSSTREGDRRPRIYRVEVHDTVAADTLRAGMDADWSALDDRIIFKGCDGTGNACGLWLMDGSGANAVALTNVVADSRPRWSPDGTHVLFMSDGRDGNWEIYMIRLADGTVMRMTEEPGEDGLPVFSPGGDSMAWVARRDGSWGIYVQTLPDGLPVRIHTFGGEYPNWLEQGIDWAP